MGEDKSEDSNFLKHVPCEKCGSSDAAAVYDDGHTYCFSCRAHSQGDGAPAPAPAAEPSAAKPVPGLLSDLSYAPLLKRGISLETCKFWGYGLSEYGGAPCQVAQYHDKDGNLVAQKLRFANKRFAFIGNAKNALLFGQHLWRDGGKYVVVTEGEIDAMSLSHVQGNRWPVVSVPNGASGAAKSVARSLDWLLTFENVVFMFDSDEPGKAAALECAELLPPGRAKIAQIPLKDANEMLVAGRGEELRVAIFGARTYRPDGILDSDAVLERMQKIGAVHPICPMFSPGLQEKIGGFFRGRLLTFTGGSGSGKTELVRAECGHAMEHGAKIGVISLEESVERSLLGFIGQRMKRRLDLLPDPMAVPGFMDAYGSLRHRAVFYDHFGAVDTSNILQRIRYMRQAEGCDIVVLDNLTIMSSGSEGEGERTAIDAAVSGLASLCQETGVTIILVVHLKRPLGKAHEEGGATSMAQLRGSGGIGHFSMEVVGIERNQQCPDNPNLVTLRVLKNRKTGKTGIAGQMRFNVDTGEFVPEGTFAAAVAPADPQAPKDF